MNRSRRRVLLAGAGVGAALALALRPSETGAPHAPYFARLAQALRNSDVPTDASTPVMVLDLDRVRANIRQVLALKHAALPLRIVAKSLPSPNLLELIAQQTGSTRQMVFNLPYLLALLAARTPHDVLLGKPLPVGAAHAFYQRAAGATPDAVRAVQWLVDTPERLAEYAQLARAWGVPLRVNLEIDVGLHRGGFASAAALAQALTLLRSEPLLQFAGMMGYDPHVTEIPDLPGARRLAQSHAKAAYADFKAQALAGLPAARAEALTWNAAGSPTFHLYGPADAASEVSVGSAFVKPADFDLPHLATCEPACFIATPVLKSGAFALPLGVEWVGQALTAWDRNQRHGVFVYGGQWRADAVSPAGLAPSGLYGLSPNQQVFVGSGRQALKPGDTLFLRPHKSEALLQQFGPLVVVAGGRMVDHWPVRAPAP